MRLGIDASTIKEGGGATHLTEVLRAVDPASFGFQSVVLWAPEITLQRIEDRPWLVKRSLPVFERHYLRRAWWQFRHLGELARAEGCGLLLVVGGSFATPFRPIVTMSRNMLPFQLSELLRFGLSQQTARLLLLRRTQSRSFKAADGVIFLTHYARDAVCEVTGPIRGEQAIIPHGVDTRFAKVPRRSRALEECTVSAPLRLLYVSIIDVYKHQWHVVEAVAALRGQGYPVFLELVGPAYGPALRRLLKTMRRFDPEGRAVRYLGPTPYAQLDACYERAEIGVFASSCENLPNILLETMAAGLPIACSNRGPMPEVLADAGRYFDPEDPQSIASAILELMCSAELRERLANAAYERARSYSWAQCAQQTFAFLAQVAADHARL
jgi:glycosyltransferase involved in cell wall biosynthesis